ncbi:hypothetical protein AAC691_10365 [Nguyenibacter vanlangensis]|uniref:Uncharacterized protein n=1 Tax=Nguyenibacter vanlangensis TaxID=1216886 RepID=A0ABZ3DBH2_9PROT
MTEEEICFVADGSATFYAEIRVLRPEPKVFSGFELWFNEMPRGPLHREIEERAAAGADEAELARWLEKRLNDEKLVVCITFERDKYAPEDGVAVFADIARIDGMIPELADA